MDDEDGYDRADGDAEYRGEDSTAARRKTRSTAARRTASARSTAARTGLRRGGRRGVPRRGGRPRRGVLRRGQDCGGEEDEEYRGEEDGCDEECSGEDGRGEADRTAERTDAAWPRTATANRRAGTTSAVDEDVVAVTEKQCRSWRRCR